MSGVCSSVRRRSVLSGLAASVAGLTGCSGASDRREGVSILAAGSLSNALDNGLTPTVDRPVRIESRGSAVVARLVDEGLKDPDIVTVADVALFETPLRPAWFAEFATNAVVVVYNPETAGGQRVADAGTEQWYEPMRSEAVTVGRTDPDSDPLGYRTLFALELATEYYEAGVDLRETIPAREQIYPETQLLSQFETGGIDAAFAYRNMAVERGYDYVELPPEIDFSDPAYADRYAGASYELPSGTVVEGSLVSYGSTIRHRSPAVRDVFEAHTTGSYLEAFGLVVPDDYPRYTGNAPGTIAG